jgi:mannose-1-phosphate guanylyltransferase
MSTCKIQPIILCGGQGTRLWPISTPQIPKQFISLGKRGTLLEETIRRILLVMERCQENSYVTLEPLLIMHHSHKLPAELSSYESGVIYEYYANDTAVAVARAALEIKNRYKDDNIIMLVLPADHYIYNIDAFVKDIADGITYVTHNNIVLYGIDPKAPESKYGYIIPSDTGVNFIEKPNISLASELIKQKALWNSGIFAANVDLILKRISASSYNIMGWVKNPHEGKAPSFDVAVLQEYSDIYAHHCFDWKWSDVGTWGSFMDILEIKEEMDLNEKSQNIVMMACDNISVLNRACGNIVLIGCENLFVVANGHDILIMPNKGDYNNHLKEAAVRLGK